MTKKYQQIRDNMQTGDVIAFSGKGRVSQLIKWKTNSHISHVGLVLDAEYIKGEKRIILIESTTLNVLKDLKHGELIKGVQQHHLSQLLDIYDGTAYWLALAHPLNQNQKTDMVKWLLKKHSKRTPYDAVQAMGSAFDLLDGLGLENEPDYNRLFCSELIAKAYKIAGLATGNPSEYTPQDIIDLKFLKDKVKLK